MSEYITDSIRKMDENDVDRVSEIERECFQSPWSANSLLSALKSGSADFFVYEENKEIIAYMGMYICAGEGDIANIAVCRAYRGKKIASKLLDAVLKYETEKSVREFTLEVRPSNKVAIVLYEKRGLKVEGVRKNYYDFPKEDALIMCRRDSDK